MKLKPFIEDEIIEEPDAISEILSATGLKRGKSAKIELDEIRGIFENEGAGISDTAKTVGSLMRSSEKEEVRLRAAELALRVQGVFKEIDERAIPVFNFTIAGEGNQTVINLVCPQE